MLLQYCMLSCSLRTENDNYIASYIRFAYIYAICCSSAMWYSYLLFYDDFQKFRFLLLMLLMVVRCFWCRCCFYFDEAFIEMGFIFQVYFMHGVRTNVLVHCLCSLSVRKSLMPEPYRWTVYKSNTALNIRSCFCGKAIAQ